MGHCGNNAWIQKYHEWQKGEGSASNDHMLEEENVIDDPPLLGEKEISEGYAIVDPQTIGVKALRECAQITAWIKKKHAVSKSRGQPTPSSHTQTQVPNK